MSKTTKNMTTSPPVAERTPWDVNHLRVLVPYKGDFVPLKPGSSIFDCTVAVVSLALDMLECRASILVLKDITRQIIEQRKHNVELRNMTESQIEPKIFQFLGFIRQSFPHVLVTNENCMAYKNGRTKKRDCEGQFNPQTAAVIELNQILIQRMVNYYKELLTRDSETARQHFKNIHFRLSITMAHELVHVYNLFLQRQRFVHTPPNVTSGGYGDDNAGESGRYWESRLFGGVVEMRDSSANPANSMETICLRNAQATKCWRITMEVIDGILARHLNVWLQPSTPLTDEDYPKGTRTQVLDHFTWKRNCPECLPHPPAKLQEPTGLSEVQINRLIGSKMLGTPSYSLSGKDLRTFSLEPRTRLRQVRA